MFTCSSAAAPGLELKNISGAGRLGLGREKTHSLLPSKPRRAVPYFASALLTRKPAVLALKCWALFCCY